MRVTDNKFAELEGTPIRQLNWGDVAILLVAYRERLAAAKTTLELEMEVAFCEGFNVCDLGEIPDNPDGTPGSLHDAFVRWRG